MRLAKYIFVFLSVVATGIASLVTLGLNSGDAIFYVAAVWFTALLSVTLVVVLLRGYQRIVSRLSTANERLAELRFLQERRYEQTRVRLDDLLDIASSISATSGDIRKVAGGITERPITPLQPSELADLNVRLQRIERRIVGRLENEFHTNDLRNRQIERLVSQIEAAIQNYSHDGD